VSANRFAEQALENATARLLEVLRLDLDLKREDDRFRLVVSAANWAIARLVRRELRRRGEMEWALWRIPVPRLPQRFESKPALSRGRVLWIPGWGDSPMSWLAVLAGAFAGSGFDEVVVLDFPGFHGTLAHRRCITDMDRLLEVARDTIQELHPEVVAGHSLGGWLATWGLLHADARTPVPSKLLLMAPSGVTGGSEERELWRAEFRSWTEADVETYLARVFGKKLPWIAPVMHRFVPFMKRDDTQEFLNSVSDRHFLEGALSGLRSEVRLLWGEEDGVVPERFATQWISRLPSVRYEKWRGVGHMPHLEAPLQLARWIRGGVG
jgi:pimeloyl-ACP methyl ester carboxylesterase